VKVYKEIFNKERIVFTIGSIEFSGVGNWDLDRIWNAEKKREISRYINHLKILCTKEIRPV